MKTLPILLLGFILAMMAAPGQTSFMALFTPYIQNDFQLSATKIGFVYSMATLCSALCLPFLGFWIKRSGYRKSILSVCFLLCFGTICLAFTKYIFFLFLGLALLRFSANGSFPVFSRAIIVTSFDKNRGKALSFANLGQPLGEALFPILVSLLLSIFSWQKTWGILGAVFLLFVFPLFIFLVGYLEKFSKKTIHIPHEMQSPSSLANKKLFPTKHYTVEKVLRDPQFYILLPAILYPPFILSGLFFYHGIFAQEKGFTLHHIAQGFLFYGLAQSISILLSGIIIDRFTAKKMMYLHLIPICFGFLCFYFASHPIFIFLYLALAGITTGFGGNVKAAFWPEVYGVGDIERIISVISAIIALSTAIGPPCTGFLLDSGFKPSLLMEIAITIGIGVQVLLYVGLSYFGRTTGHTKKGPAGSSYF